MVDILLYIFRYVYVYLPEDPSSNKGYRVSIYELEVFGGLPSADPPTVPPACIHGTVDCLTPSCLAISFNILMVTDKLSTAAQYTQ